jgi:hypothetical protein
MSNYPIALSGDELLGGLGANRGGQEAGSVLFVTVDEVEAFEQT